MSLPTYDYNIHYIKRDTKLKKPYTNLTQIAERTIAGVQARHQTDFERGIAQGLLHYVLLAKEIPEMDYDAFAVAYNDKSAPIDDEGHTSGRVSLTKTKGDYWYHDMSSWGDLGFHIDTETEIDPDREKIPSNAIIALSRYRDLPPEGIHREHRLYEHDVYSFSIPMLETELKYSLEGDMEHLMGEYIPYSVKSHAQLMVLLTEGPLNEEYMGLMTFNSSGEPVYTRY